MFGVRPYARDVGHIVERATGPGALTRLGAGRRGAAQSDRPYARGPDLRRGRRGLRGRRPDRPRRAATQRAPSSAAKISDRPSAGSGSRATQRNA